jgi:hypothetical protein
VIDAVVTVDKVVDLMPRQLQAELIRVAGTDVVVKQAGGATTVRLTLLLGGGAVPLYTGEITPVVVVRVLATVTL